MATERARETVSGCPGSLAPPLGLKKKNPPCNPRCSVGSEAQKGSDVKIPEIVKEIKLKADCREIFKESWSAKYRDQGNSVCPFHEDRTPSMQVTKELAHCHAGCGSFGAVDLYAKGMGIPNGEAIKRLAAKFGLNSGKSRREVAVYNYTDEDGQLLFQVVRYEPKDFRQRSPDGNGGWIWNLKDVRRVPYLLPAIMKARDIFIPEGEKDVDNLTAKGITATTCPQGAGNWPADFARYFQRKNVAIIPDNDDPGRKHAAAIARNLHGTAATIKILELPGLPRKGDVSDWLGEGGTAEELLSLAYNAHEYDPKEDRGEKIGADAKLEDHSTGRPGKETQAQRLIQLGADATLFYSTDGGRFAEVTENGHHEVLEIRRRGFRDWLNHRFYLDQGKPPGAQALQDAVRLFEAKAQYEGEEHPTFVRLGSYAGSIYLDLCTPSWEVVRVTATGWGIVTDSPVKFRRPGGMLSLPYPVHGGRLTELRPFLNVPDENAFILVCAYLIQALRSTGPYPVLNMEGEEGGGKSLGARVVRSLIDPSTATLRTTPRDERDLMIAAKNAWLLAFDNLSGVQPWLSDAFCRLSTGGGFSTRELYSDSEEVIFDATRPLLLTGIDRIASRHDLLNRSITITLPFIPEYKRRSEAVFWRDFEAAKPRILGALLDAVNVAIRDIDSTRLDRLPRMADFALWVTAAEKALPWTPGAFIQAYGENRKEAVSVSLNTDAVASSICAFMESKTKWEGTATELLEHLKPLVPEDTLKDKAWPKTAKAFGRKLRRSAELPTRYRH